MSHLRKYILKERKKKVLKEEKEKKKALLDPRQPARAFERVSTVLRSESGSHKNFHNFKQLK